MSNDAREVLGYGRTIAVVGASRDSGKPSGKIPHLLQHRGYRVIPVNPTASEINGEPAYASLLDIKEPLDVVDVFRPAAEAAEIARQAVAIGARALWLQLGIKSDEARSIAEAAGLDYIEDLCMGSESVRLQIAQTYKPTLRRTAEPAPQGD